MEEKDIDMLYYNLIKHEYSIVELAWFAYIDFSKPIDKYSEDHVVFQRILQKLV